jgi:hypothetical protein
MNNNRWVSNENAIETMKLTIGQIEVTMFAARAGKLEGLALSGIAVSKG